MKEDNLNRRDFNRLTMAAFSGMLAGTAAGCAKREDETTGSTGFTPVTPGSESTSGTGAESGTKESAGSGAEEAAGLWMADIHVCRGLNACKGKGADKKNACAGQGSCATAKEHACSAQNDCKFQGGCGEKPGENACKGMGECSVPLGEDIWAKARSAFEKAMKAAGKEVGKAPEKG